MIRMYGGQATLGANTFTGAQNISGAINASSNVLAGVSSYVGFTGSTLIGAPTDGNLILINNAGGSFGRLQFGGTTSSFPAIKRNAAGIDFRLADDSGYADMNGRTFTASTYLRVSAQAYANLPSPGGAGAGAFAHITDATATTSRSVAAGGGANKVMVWSDGTNWLIF